MKCSNCGAEVAEGMKFCGDCGAPVPQEKTCISCGAKIALKMKFCPECGASQDSVASKPKFNAAAFAMGDKNVIAGDVVSNVTNNTTNNTTINNTYEAKKDVVCHVCGKTIAGGEYYTCSKCGQVTCTKCYHIKEKLCNPCFEQQKQGYRELPVKEVSLDDSTWYSSIQEAINDSKDGDTIKIKNGEYLEDLKINKKVTIEPFSLRDQPVLIANRRARIEITDDVIFKDIEFRTDKNLGATNENLIEIKNGTTVFERCFTTYSEYTVICVIENGSAELTDCTFSNVTANHQIEFGAKNGKISSGKNLTFNSCINQNTSFIIGSGANGRVTLENLKFIGCHIGSMLQALDNSKLIAKNVVVDGCEFGVVVASTGNSILCLTEYEERIRSKFPLAWSFGQSKLYIQAENIDYSRIEVKENSKLLSAEEAENFQLELSLQKEDECFNSNDVGFERPVRFNTSNEGASENQVISDYFVEDKWGNKRQIWFFVKKDEKPDADGKYYNFGALVSEQDVEDYIFIVRHDDFLDPEQYYDEDETDLSREEQKECSLEVIFKFCFEGKQIDASQIDYTPEDSDGTEDVLKLSLQASINTQYNDTYELFFFSTRCSIFGDYIDEYGNNCSTDTSSVCVSNSGVDYYNVKELINSGAVGDDYVFDDYIRKIPVIFFSYYRYTEYGEQWQDIDFDDYLRDDYDHYILDKNGNKVKSLKNLESFEHDGVTYYRVAESDFKDSNTGNSLTPEALAKWKAKLGL